MTRSRRSTPPSDAPFSSVAPPGSNCTWATPVMAPGTVCVAITLVPVNGPGSIDGVSGTSGAGAIAPVASVGLTEKAAREAGHEVRIGKFPFAFSGRALAADETEGFVKLVFDAKFGELLGAHLIGSQATELISELVMAKKLEATEEEILHAMHPHPTYSEAIMEAAGQGLGESVHI